MRYCKRRDVRNCDTVMSSHWSCSQKIAVSFTYFTLAFLTTVYKMWLNYNEDIICVILLLNYKNNLYAWQHVVTIQFKKELFILYLIIILQEWLNLGDKKTRQQKFLQLETKLDDKLSVSLLPYSRKHNTIIIHFKCI